MVKKLPALEFTDKVYHIHRAPNYDYLGSDNTCDHLGSVDVDGDGSELDRM